MTPKNIVRNEKGIITIDFIFAIVLIFGFTMLLFKMMFTLCVASMTQYITFAAARNYVAAHVTPEMQGLRAIAKYKELINSKEFAPLYRNGWYRIDNVPKVGDISVIMPGYQQDADYPNQFIGVATNFNARVLDFQIPFFGSTVPDGDGSGSGFTTFMGSYLGREVSTSECLEFVENRWRAIRALTVKSGAAYSEGSPESGYMPMADDGC
jgi:hypothetical protein